MKLRDLKFFYKLGKAFKIFLVLKKTKANAAIGVCAIIDKAYNNRQLQMMGSKFIINGLN
jgi:hypothetical protein